MTTDTVIGVVSASLLLVLLGVAVAEKYTGICIIGSCTF